MALDRNQVPAERKWRVEDIFESVEAWNALYAECEGELDFSEFEGKLNTVETVLACMEKASADLQTDHGGKHHTAVCGVILVQKAVQRAHNRGGSLCGIASGFRVGGVTLLPVKMQNHAA